jgi:hypothetical protein
MTVPSIPLAARLAYSAKTRASLARFHLTWQILRWPASLLAIVAVSAMLLDVLLWGVSSDVHTYWAAHLDSSLYRLPVNAIGAYEYPPVLGQLIAPLTALPYWAFRVIWLCLQLVLVLAVTGPRWFGVALLLPFTQDALINGNLHFEFGVVALFGLRLPALWAFAFLTKITPGIGVLWFIARKEYRNLAIAVTVTAIVLGLSFAAAPDLWFAWGRYILDNANAGPQAESLPVPLLIRLPIVAVLVVYAARSDRAWLLPIAVWLALPYVWWSSAVILLAAPRIWAQSQTPRSAKDRTGGSASDVT